MNLFLAIISLIINFFIKPVFAIDYQDIVSSLDNSVDSNAQIYVESGTPIILPSVAPIISPDSNPNDSSKIREPSSLKNGADPIYEINDQVEIELYNQDANQIETVLTNSQNQIIATEVSQVDNKGITTLIVDPPSQIQPGKYTLEITDQVGTKIEQDFLWGVLAINPNKSVYNPNETANLAMAVLSESGDVICDAILTLKITKPDGNISELTTENGKIIVNQDECQSRELTFKPDYQAEFLTSETGKYLMELTARTKNGVYTINDSFDVQSGILFDIERISATRIYPLNIYPMTINIKAKQDFSGKISEEVPSVFDIIEPKNEFIKYSIDETNQGIKKIIWEINIKKGESFTLNYQYKAPNISPQFYLAGPLKILNLTDLIYQESRRWQIAADTTETFTTSQNWYVPDHVFSLVVEAWGGGGAGGGLTANRVKARGAGGAGGQYVYDTITNVNPGTSFAITVGAGGTASTGSGGSGGDSRFIAMGNGTTYVVAKGGAGGQSYDAGFAAGVGTTANGIGDTIYKGGNGSVGGTGNTGGAGGGGAGSGGAGGDANANVGGSGTATGGGSGGNGITISGNGNIGTTYGGAGSGGGNTLASINTDRNGGTGARGYFKITYTLNNIPNTPINLNPTTGTTAVSTTPILVGSTFNDVDVGDTQGNSQWQLATDSGFTNIIFDTGTSGVGTTSVTVSPALNVGTSYFWKVRYRDNHTNHWSNYSTATNFQTFFAPNIPILTSPANNAVGVTIKPTLQLVTTDPEGNPLQYRIILATSANFTGTTQTFDQQVSNVGWVNQNVGTSAYSSGTTASYTLQSNLSIGTTYYWKAQAIDYSGSNIWGNFSVGSTFTTENAANSPPNTPVIISPGSTATIGSGTNYTTDADPRAVATADFNHDGYTDIVTAGATNNTITILLNDGDGTFATGVTYPATGGYTRGVTAADYNSDGYADVATANYNGYNHTVFINNGDGTFAAGTVYSNPSGNPTSILSADINNDNKIDLITSDANSHTITVFKNYYGVGASTFDSGTTYSTIGSNPYSVTSGDVNNDGYLDLISANYDGDNVTVFTNNGSGTFGTGVTYPVSGDIPYAVTSTDFNGDGYADITTANQNSNDISVLTNNGDGTFAAATNYSTIDSSPQGITFADINQDNYPDVISANSGNNKITVFINNKSGAFGTGSTYPTNSSGSVSVASGDFNADKKLDLVTANFSGNNVTVFQNNYPLNNSITPSFKTVTTDGENDNLQYEIKYCTDLAMSVGCSTFNAGNTGWSNADVGTSSYSSGTTATYVLQTGNSLAEGQTIYWKSKAIDPAGSNTWSGTQTNSLFFITGVRPKTPTLISPQTGTTGVSLTPSLTTVTTDINGDNLQYKIELCTNSAMSVGCTTYDITSTNVGWSGMNVGTSAFSSGSTATYTLQTNLAVGTSFYWRSYALDYDGLNRWSSTQSTPNSFVTRPPSPTLTQASFRWSADDASGESRGSGVGDTWLTNYTYRLPLNVTNNIGSSLSNYQVGFTLNTSSAIGDSKMQSDCDDIRLTTLDKQTTIPYWIQSGCGTTQTIVWLKIPSLAASAGTTLYIYYGNTAAAIASDGNTTFDFFDDFSGTSLDTSKWTDWNPDSYGNITISGGTMTIGTSKTTGYTDKKARGIVSNNTFPFVDSGHYIETRSIWDQPDPEGSCGQIEKGIILNESNSINGVGSTNTTLCSQVSKNDGTGYVFHFYRFGGFLGSDIASYKFGMVQNNTFVRITESNSTSDANRTGRAQPSDFVIEKYRWFDSSGEKQGFDSSYNQGVGWTANNWAQQSETTFTLPRGMYIYLYNLNASNSVNNWARWDWLRIRKYASTEPTSVLGTETTMPTGGASGATWLVAENVGVTGVDKNENIRVRFSVKNTNETDTFNFRLQVAPKGESTGCTGVPSANFSDVPTTAGSAVAVMTTSPNFTNQEATTNQLTDSSTTFIAGKMVEHDSNQTNDITLGTNEFTEVEYNFQMTDNAGGNTDYCFRLVDIGNTLNTYTQVAQLTTTSSAVNEAPLAPFLPYVNNTTAQSGQQTPVYGLIDHTPAFSAVFDDPNTSDTAASYQIQVGTDSDWASAETWDSTKTAVSGTCNENSRCSDVVYGGGTSLTDGSTYYWRIKFWDNSDVGGSWSDTQQFSMNNSPTVSSVVINGNNSINLSENSSIGISWTATVTDADAFTDLTSVTGKIYRSDLGSTCTLDNNNCYTDASCDMSNCDGNSCSALCSANLYFFTEATDTGSTYASQYYQAWVQATDSRSEVGSTISSSTTVDVNSMSAFSIGSSLVYGEVFAGSDTGSSNTEITITNTGNSLINLEITGDYMCTVYPSCSSAKIEPSYQQYKLSNFTYGTGETLSTSPTVVNIGISKPTQSPSNSFRNLYWGIGIPSGKEVGNYQGATTILVD